MLAAVVVTPAVTLVWLGLLLLAQDRELMAQRDFDRREAAAQAAARSLERSIATAEQQVPLGVGLVRFTFEREGLKADPPNRVWWVPVAPKPVTSRRASSPLPRRSSTGERPPAPERPTSTWFVRYRGGYRAGALLRLARVDRRAHRWNAALDAYRRLAEHVDISIEGAAAGQSPGAAGPLRSPRRRRPA